MIYGCFYKVPGGHQKNTCQYPWHLHSLLDPIVTLSWRHSCKPETKILSHWQLLKPFHLMSNLVFSSYLRRKVGSVHCPSSPPPPHQASFSCSLPTSVFDLPGLGPRGKGLGKWNHAAAEPFLCWMCGWLLLPLVGIFMGAWKIPPLDFSKSNSWHMDLSSQLTACFPLSPGSSDKFVLHRLSQLEFIFSSAQSSGADLKMAASQLPHRLHVGHEGASYDPPGKHSHWPHAAAPLCSTLPASVSVPPHFLTW